MRSALAQGCAPTVLTGVLWGTWRVWTIDADRGIPARRRAAICRATGVPPEAVEAAALKQIARRVAGRRPTNEGGWPWMTTLRTGRLRTSVPQYCRLCLGDTGAPYYRIGWRLAWHTGCAEHGVTLAETCPGCDRPQQLHQLAVDAHDIAACATCGRDLWKAEATPCDTDALELQRTADQVVLTGTGQCFGADVDTAEWFAIADFFASLIRQAIRAPTKGLTEALTAAGVDWPLQLPAAPGSRIELLDRRNRETLLRSVQRIMTLDRDGLYDALETADISWQGLFGERTAVPRTLAAIVPALPDRAKPHRRQPSRKRRSGPRPRHEVLKMMNRLESRLEDGTK